MSRRPVGPPYPRTSLPGVSTRLTRRWSSPSLSDVTLLTRRDNRDTQQSRYPKSEKCHEGTLLASFPLCYYVVFVNLINREKSDVVFDSNSLFSEFFFSTTNLSLLAPLVIPDCSSKLEVPITTHQRTGREHYPSDRVKETGRLGLRRRQGWVCMMEERRDTRFIRIKYLYV